MDDLLAMEIIDGQCDFTYIETDHFFRQQPLSFEVD